MRIRTFLVIRFVVLTVTGLIVSVYPLRAAQDLSLIAIKPLLMRQGKRVSRFLYCRQYP